MSDSGDPYWSGGGSDAPDWSTFDFSGGAGSYNPDAYGYVDEFTRMANDPYGPFSNWGQDTLSSMGVSPEEKPSFLKSLLDRLKGTGQRAANFATSDRGLLTLLAAIAAARDRQKPSGGGIGTAYAGATPLQRQIVQGKYGPIARYAAGGGITNAYAGGGRVLRRDIEQRRYGPTAQYREEFLDLPPAPPVPPAPVRPPVAQPMAPLVTPSPVPQVAPQVAPAPQAMAGSQYVYQPTKQEIAALPPELRFISHSLDPKQYPVPTNQPNLHFIDPQYTTYQQTLPATRYLGADMAGKIADAAKSGDIKSLTDNMSAPQLRAAANIVDYLYGQTGPSDPLWKRYSSARDYVRNKYIEEFQKNPQRELWAEGGSVRNEKVQMEDGGFVMTKKAVDGAGGPQGITQLVPGARMIGGPPDPTGRRDLTPAVINGPSGQTPARVSRGEAYIPRSAVETNGGADAMYALMNSLQRRA